MKFSTILSLISLVSVNGRLIIKKDEIIDKKNLRELSKNKVNVDKFCSSPVSKEKVVFPDSLAGRANINFEMYSGYVNITSEDYYFYWFFGTRDGNSNAPLIIWTNGMIYIKLAWSYYYFSFI